MKPATMPQPLPWKLFYKLIVDMVEDATALPRKSIYWSQQDLLKAIYPLCALNVIAGPTPLSNDDNLVETAFNTGAPAGEEVTAEHRVPVTFTVSCRFEVGPGVSDDGLDNNADPSCNALAMATAVNSEIRKGSRRETLNGFGLAVVRSNPVTNISAAVGAQWISRANVDIEFAARACVTEKFSAIESVSGAGTVTDPSGPDVTSSFVAPIP